MFRGILFFTLFFLSLFVLLPLAQAAIGTVRVHIDGVLDEKGDMTMAVRWAFPTNAMYLQVKTAYPNPYVIVRNLLGTLATMELEDVKVSYEDQNNTLWMNAKVLGAATSKRQKWTLFVGRGTEMLYARQNEAMFLGIGPLGDDALMVATMNVRFPEGVSDLKFDEKAGFLMYNLQRNPARGSASAEVDVRVKPRILSAAYKVYGNPDFGQGSYWVAKAIFRNTGSSDIVDLRIKYKLGEYTPWSPESIYSLVAPGGTVVDFYYPIISPQVAELRSASYADLLVEYSYKDLAGNTYSDTLSYRLQILGINQFEFSNLPEEEQTGAWADAFSNAPLLAAFVTKLDDPVKAFAGLVSQFAGGVAAASNDDDAYRFCKALYELEVANGISYQTPSGFLVNYVPAGQDIKYPRDVLRDKAGTCVDLAILYASVCEAVGLDSYIVVIPGHAFPVIVLPSGALLPVESTGVGGAALGQSAPFEKAVEIGEKNLRELKLGQYFIVRVKELQSMGIIPPELPRLPADILSQWGYKVPQAQLGVPLPQPAFDVQSQPLQPQPTLSLSGQYQGTYQDPSSGVTGSIVLVLTQSENALQGRIEIHEEGYVVQGTISGNVSGNVVQLRAALVTEYGNLAVVFNGTVQGNTISGNYVLPDLGSSGSFTVQKVR